MAGFKELLEGLARSSQGSSQGGAEGPKSTDLASSILASVSNRVGTNVGDSIQQAMLSQVQKQIETEFKNYLIGRGVSKNLLETFSFSQLLAKRKELGNKSDEELWAGVQNLMVAKGGMNEAVAGMLVGLLQQNVDMGTIKGLLGGTAMPQDVFKMVLSAIGNNPKNARMLADHQECIKLLLGSMQGEQITPDYVMKVVQECQKSKQSAKQYETDSDGGMSDPMWPKAVGRRTVGALDQAVRPYFGVGGRDDDEEEDEGEDEGEDDEGEDEEEDGEGDEEDEAYETSSESEESNEFESASDGKEDEEDEEDDSE
jgi:hypothetical protein